RSLLNCAVHVIKGLSVCYEWGLCGGFGVRLGLRSNGRRFIAVESSLTTHGAVGFEDVSRRRFTHYDVLQTHQTVKESFGPGRATRNVDVNRNGPVNTLHGRIGIEWASSRGAGAHGDGPFWFRHLIKHSPDDRSHF